VTTLEEAAALARNEHGLVIVATLRGDETIPSSLVNAGIVPHPATGESAQTGSAPTSEHGHEDVPRLACRGPGVLRR